MGWVGSRFDNAAAEPCFSTLEWGVLSRNDFRGPGHARQVVLEFYNTIRRHTSAKMVSPIDYQSIGVLELEAAQRSPPRFGESLSRVVRVWRSVAP